MHTLSSPAAEKAGPREWIGLAVLALPTLLVSIDVSVMILALPHIGTALNADSTQLLWIMDIYGFLLAGFMVTMGTLGDRIGRRKLLMIGGAAFGIASVLAAFAPTAETLIIARALLGVAGATISPSILALITNMFRNEAERGFAISVWLVAFMGGLTLGPVVGGFLLEQFWWGAAFLLGVPVMVLLLVTAPFLLPEYRDSKAGRIDLVSVALSLVTILPVVYGLKEVAKNGVEPAALAAVAVGLGFGLAFIARQRRLADPLLDLSLFANPSFRVAVGGMFLVTVTGASMLYTNQYLQLVLGYSPLVSGLLSLPAMVTSAGGFLLAPIVAKYLRPSVLIGSGLVLSAVGSALLLTTTVESGVVALIVGSTLSSIGFAPMVTLSSGIVMGSVQPEKAGSAAALQETCSELGFGLGIASLGSLGGVIYRALVPADVAGAARDHLAGAVAANLPPETLFAAREAFLAGMHAVVLITTGVTLLVAIVAFVAFRHLPPLGQQAPEAAADEALPQAA